MGPQHHRGVGEPEDDAVNMKWTRDCFEAACGSNLERLATLKHKYDPDNFFRHTKGVLGS